MTSGLNGSRYLLSSIAKVRFDSGLIHRPRVVGAGERHLIEFSGPGAVWRGENMQLCDSLNLNRPLMFRTAEEATLKLRSLGF